MPRYKVRIPVVLKDDDNKIMLQLKSALEARLQKSLSMSEVVRIALREQAKAEKAA